MIKPQAVPRDRLVQQARAAKRTLGETIRAGMPKAAIPDPQDAPDGVVFHNFLHAVDSSDWLGAAYFLFAGDSPTLQHFVAQQDTSIGWLGNQYLRPLFEAAEHFDRDREQWQGQLKQAFHFGKLPAYGPAVIDGNVVDAPYARKNGVAAQGRKLAELIAIFQEYERINQQYQPPAWTADGAPIRFTQGHNWSYLHARTDLGNPERFRPAQRRVLMNWDAHRDLASPLSHLRGALSLVRSLIPHDEQRLLRLLHQSGSRQELVELSGMISIAGWILPLLHGRAFEQEGVSELVLVVPPEAQATSGEDYWPPYGTHEIEVGHLAVGGELLDGIYASLDALRLLRDLPTDPASPNAETEKIRYLRQDLERRIDPLVDFQGFAGIHSVSKEVRLQTVEAPLDRLVQGRRKVLVHIVDPDDTRAILQRVRGSEIYLSIDVDYTGSIQLGGWYSENNSNPHYPLNKTPVEEARHRQLLDRFASFYQQAAQQIKAISVANSPDYTADETRRRPAAHVLNTLTHNVSREQPNWVAGESRRVVPPRLAEHSQRTALLSLAGLLGVSATTALLWHYRRKKKIKAASVQSADSVQPTMPSSDSTRSATPEPPSRRTP